MFYADNQPAEACRYLSTAPTSCWLGRGHRLVSPRKTACAARQWEALPCPRSPFMSWLGESFFLAPDVDGTPTTSHCFWQESQCVGPVASGAFPTARRTPACALGGRAVLAQHERSRARKVAAGGAFGLTRGREAEQRGASRDGAASFANPASGQFALGVS